MAISSKFVIIAAILILCAHLVVAGLGWYISYPWIHVLFHLVGGAWASVLFFLLFAHFVDEHLSHHGAEKVKLLIVAVSFSAWVGVLWQIHEFVLSEYVSIYLQQSMSQVITSLVMDMVGAAIAGGILLAAKKNPSSRTLPEEY